MFAIRIKKNNQFETYTSKNREFVLGRATDCDVVIKSDVISRHHLKITVEAHHIEIVDLKSANGTFKNGERIETQTPYIISQKDRIRLGNMSEEIYIYESQSVQELNPAPKAPSKPPESKITSLPQILSVQQVSKKVDAILDNAKQKAREMIKQAETDADKSISKAIGSAEKIIFDAKDQATKIVINGEESTKVIIQKAKFDAETIVARAHVQAKQITDKSALEAELAATEGRRLGESLVKNELLEIENQKIQLRKMWLEEEKKLRADFEKTKDEGLSHLKKHIFEEKEKIRKEIDEKRNLFAKELIKKQETLRAEEDQFLDRKDAIEIAVQNLMKKEEALKNEFAQKSLALKMQHEEEKSKAEVLINDQKRKYDEEIEGYKKKEMDRINTFLRQEQDSINESKKMNTMQEQYSLKKAMIGTLDKELHKILDSDQVSSLIEKLSHEIDKTANNREDKKNEQAPSIGQQVEKSVDKRNSKISMIFGLSASLMALVAFVFWDSIYVSIQSSESYAKFMFNKMQVESIYIPIQSTEWKASYHQRVLYFKDYVDFKTNPIYTDKWTQHLTNVENARSLKLNEDDMIQFLAREINLVNQLSVLQKTIDARQLDLGIAKLKNAEDEAIADFLRILKSKENIKKVAEWEKQFVMEHMSRLQQQRLPTDAK